MKTGIFQAGGRSSSGSKIKRTSLDNLDKATDKKPKGSSGKVKGKRSKKARY